MFLAMPNSSDWKRLLVIANALFSVRLQISINLRGSQLKHHYNDTLIRWQNNRTMKFTHSLNIFISSLDLEELGNRSW